MTNDKNKYLTLPIGNDLLFLVDSAIDRKDEASLNALRGVIGEIVTWTDIIDEHISLMEITEYIAEAQHLLSEGATPEEIRASGIRLLLRESELESEKSASRS